MKDRIKQLIDDECLTNIWYKCPKYRVEAKDSKTGKSHKAEVSCWMCHRNDELTQRIADAVEVRK